MDRTQAKALLPILTAYAEGKDVQKRDIHGNWYTVINPRFAVDPDRYRIKPDSFVRYVNVYSQDVGSSVKSVEDLVTGGRQGVIGGRQGYLTITWEEGRFKDVTFTKV